MTIDFPSTGRSLRSLVTTQGTLEISLMEVAVLEPGPHEVVVRVEASPINPSDLGLLFAGADMSRATVSGTTESPLLTAPVDVREPHYLSATREPAPWSRPARQRRPKRYSAKRWPSPGDQCTASTERLTLRS